MKKLLGIFVLGLLLSGNAYADSLMFECSNAKYSYIKFDLDLNRKIIDLKFTYRNGKTDTNRLVFNSYDNEKVISNGAFTWYYGTDQRYVNKAGKTTYYKCKQNKSNIASSSSNSLSMSTDDKITQSKQICRDLGFKANTEKFADCALKMMSIQFEATNKVASSGGTTQEIIVKHKQDYDVWDALLDVSNVLLSDGNNNSSSSSTVSYTHLTLPTKRIV